MILWGLEFEEQIGFIGDDGSKRVLDRVKSDLFKERAKGILILCSERFLKRFYSDIKNQSDCETSFNLGSNKISFIHCKKKNLMFRNFSLISGYCNLEKLRKDFCFPKELNEAEIMERWFTTVKEEFGLQKRQIIMYNKSGIEERISFKSLSKMEYNEDLPKTEAERTVVFNYFRDHLIKKSGRIYGVLDSKIGKFQNVLKIDLGNFYGFILATTPFIKGNPFKVLKGQIPLKKELLPFEIRQRFIDNYKKGHRELSPGLKALYKGANNLTIGRSENLDIYLNRNRKSIASLLQPQHGFTVIEKGFDLMETYTKIFEDFGFLVIARDTDSLKILVGERFDEALKIVNCINQTNVGILKESGFSEEDANCGIGQFKNEGFCLDFYQIADKQYCWRDSNGEFGITCAGLSEERKEELIKNVKDFDSFVNSLKEEIKRPKTKIKIRILSSKEFGF